LQALAVINKDIGFAPFLGDVDDVATISTDIWLFVDDTRLVESGERDKATTLNVVKIDAATGLAI
jgi:hypothetical protein